jgi:hypothetical protein
VKEVMVSHIAFSAAELAFAAIDGRNLVGKCDFLSDVSFLASKLVIRDEKAYKK